MIQKSLVNKNTEQHNELDEDKQQLKKQIKKLEEDIELGNKKLYNKDKQVYPIYRLYYTK